MADQKAAAGLVIPEGYGAALEAGTPVKLTFISTFGSTGAQSVQQAVGSVLARIGGERLAAATAAHRPVAAGRCFTPRGTQARALTLATASLATPTVVVKSVDAGTAAGQIPQGFDQSSPGMLMNWILFSLLTAATGLVVERKTGALQRLLTTRATKPQIIGGKIPAMFIITFIQQILLISHRAVRLRRRLPARPGGPAGGHDVAVALRGDAWACSSAPCSGPNRRSSPAPCSSRCC